MRNLSFGRLSLFISLSLVALPASARPVSFSVADGFAAYVPRAAATPTPVQFDVLTLASGGTPDASTLAITGQPASGSASADTSSGIVTYSPTTATSGEQTVTFSLCEAGPTNCQTATLTEGPAVSINGAFAVPILGGYANFPAAYGALAPSSAAEGATFTVSVAPASFTLPATLTFSGVTATVNHLDGLTYILPVPGNATYVAGSAIAVGGDAATTGKATVTFCTSIGGSTGCSATPPGNAFPTATTTPYLELQLSGVQIPGGSAVTVPTLVAQFTASGNAGSTIEPQVTEFDITANVTADGYTQEASLATYPVDPAFTKGSTAPAYYAYPLSTTTISSGAEVDGGQPDAGNVTDAGGTEEGGDAGQIDTGDAGPAFDGGPGQTSDAGGQPGEGSAPGSATGSTGSSPQPGATGCGCTSGSADPLALGFLVALAAVLRRKRALLRARRFS